MQNFQTNPVMSASLNQVQDIGNLLSSLIDMLRAQRDILQQRGMSLPPGTLKGLQQAKGDLDTLSNAIAEQQVELNRLHALADTSALINSTLDLDEVLNRVMDTVIRLTGAERGYIVLNNPRTGELEFRIARNLDHETIAKGSFIVSRTVVEKVAETGEPVVTTNAQSDPRFANQDSVVSYALRSILCVPLKAKGQELTGVVYADNRIRDGLFGPSELELLSAFTNQAAVTIENARLFEQVKSTLAEITDHERLLENVFSSLTSSVITTDMEEHVLIFNQATQQIFSTEFALDASLRDLLAPLGESFFQAVEKVMSKDSREQLEVYPELASRGPVVLEMKLSPLKNHEQRTHGLTLLVDDLTEIRRREETLNEVSHYLPPAMVKNIRTIDNIELGGEEREITTLFADVRGFTSFSEKLQPEDLMEVINRYLSISSDAIHLYEGIIDKYMGDAVVGLYNTQLNPQDDDHALRAVRAAISMIYDVKALHEVLPPSHRLWYGIGIDTGRAVLGNVGGEVRKEFTAVGTPLVYSKKLQEAAGGGEIVLSEATYQQVKDRIAVEQIERQFRGEMKTGIMYKVLGFKRG